MDYEWYQGVACISCPAVLSITRWARSCAEAAEQDLLVVCLVIDIFDLMGCEWYQGVA